MQEGRTEILGVRFARIRLGPDVNLEPEPVALGGAGMVDGEQIRVVLRVTDFPQNPIDQLVGACEGTSGVVDEFGLCGAPILAEAIFDGVAQSREL